MRIVVRVTPGARDDHVGGRYGDLTPPVLIVRVRARAVDGAANEAVRRVLASAFGVPSSAVQLAAGRTSRSKTFDVEADVAERLRELLAE